MITQEIVKAVIKAWDESDIGLSLYHDHAPTGIPYPVAVMNVVDSPRFYSMGNSGHTSPHQYTKARITINIHGNEDMMGDLMSMAVDMESLLFFEALDLGNGVTGIMTHPVDQRVFFNSEFKTWTVSTDFVVWAGE